MNVIFPPYPVQVRVNTPGQLHVRTTREPLLYDDVPILDCAQRSHAQCDKIVVGEKGIISTLGDVNFHSASMTGERTSMNGGSLPSISRLVQISLNPSL